MQWQMDSRVLRALLILIVTGLLKDLIRKHYKLCYNKDEWNIVVIFPDTYCLHAPSRRFMAEWRVMALVCIKGWFEPHTQRDNDIKVTWLSDDSQHLSQQTNQSLQRSALVLDLFYTLSFPICSWESITDMRNTVQDRHSDAGEKEEALAAGGGKQQIAAHQHSSKETGAWLLCYGLLVNSCLRTEVSAWSSMPIRQPRLPQLLTTGSLPAAASCESG